MTISCLTAGYATNVPELPPTVKLKPISALPKNLAAGKQISLNGRILPAAWLVRSLSGGRKATYLSDGALRQLIGVDLLNTSNPNRQPIQWFSAVNQPLVVTTQLIEGNRYLDITRLSQIGGWQIQVNGNTLAITTPASKVLDLRQGQQPTGDRLVIDLDRPTPWQVKPGEIIQSASDPVDEPTPKSTTPPPREWLITLDGQVDPAIIQRYLPPAAGEVPQQLSPTPEPLIRKVEMVKDQTIIRLSVPFGQSLQVSTLNSPNRLTVDIRPDALVEKDIAWARGVRWRQKLVNLGEDKFPVVWLEVNPRLAGVKLRPIWVDQKTLTGTAPLIQTAQSYAAVAAINAGYFNRNNRLPLGAIRRDNQWISGPILNRGAIAWNNSGQFFFGRLTLAETINSNNNSLPVLFLNSGYVQSGIARYTPAWGATYTPLTDNETIIVVQKNQITNQIAGKKTGENPVTIPQDGYLLILRGNANTNAAQLPIGAKVSITSSITPTEFGRYPNIIGAGPLLVQNRQIVLDAKAEKFSDAFIAQKAVRSSICTTSTGILMISAVHNRAGGAGPTLAEQAQLMQAMGCVNALNLDGGSSTSLYLSGQLLDRPPSTAARVHNGIGIFLEGK
ncbi:MAG TPA: phosphodiester glycosidase family protein [Nostocaceae cyanobacterium]|nr:phosphodiester glycosidase family protein [Nostocaceae cyanobacterium]